MIYIGTGPGKPGRLVPVFLALSLFFSSSAFGVGTVAGTDINVGKAEVHHDNRTEYSDELSLSVSQNYGLLLVTPEIVGSLNPGGTYNFPYVLTNVGNGSDKFTLELSETTADWSSTLIKDDNLNGLRDRRENEAVPRELLLAEDAVYHFFVALTSPAAAKKDDLGRTTVSVSGSINDGSAYMGANGSLYGGADSAGSRSVARVVHVDTTPPTISDLTVSGRKRFAGDIISSRPVIQVRITDDPLGGIGRIEVWLNDELKYVGTSSNWKSSSPAETGIYSADTGVAKFDETGQLDPGTYEINIKAWDTSANLAQETLGPLYVKDNFEVVGPIVNYPNPFRPLKGETASIAYTLTKDAQITLYIHDIRGTVLWKRTYEPFEEGGKAGYNEITWNGKSDFGEVVGNGIYIIKLAHANKIARSGKVTVLDTR